MTRCVSLVVLAVVIAAGCSESRLASQPESSTPSAKAGVEAASAAFHQALRTNDVETFMAYIADDVVLAPPGEAPVRGKMGVRTWYEAFLSQYHQPVIPYAAKIAFGAVELVLLFLFLGRCGRTKGGQA